MSVFMLTRLIYFFKIMVLCECRFKVVKNMSATIARNSGICEVKACVNPGVLTRIVMIHTKYSAVSDWLKYLRLNPAGVDQI